MSPLSILSSQFDLYIDNDHYNKICFRGDAEELLDSDISHEFFRESHHIHSIPRPQVDEVSISHYLSIHLSIYLSMFHTQVSIYLYLFI